MIGIAPQEWKTDLPEFCEKTRDFYAGKMDKGSYKGFSGRYGSYAQKGGAASMLRLRMTAGCVSKEKLAFIAKAIRAYQVNMVHFTTCESVQFHNLDEKSVCELMEQALDAGIVTMGGGGDFPRNVMCSPLSGVEEGEYFDVMPWAKAAGEYLMTFINAEKMPRKLKVCFSNSPANVTHATYRDLGFAACPDGTFDRRQVRKLLRWYSYITQVVRMFDADMHKEYLFLSYLIGLLPEEKEEPIDLDGKLKLEYYKLQKTFEF